MRHSILFLLAVSLSGCTYWRVADISPQTLVATEEPSRVRVTRKDGTELVLRNASIRADTLFGVHRELRGGVQVNDSLAIPLADIRQLAVRRQDVLKSLGLTVLIAALALGVTVLIALSSYSGD